MLLGPAGTEEAHAALGAPLDIAPAAHAPAGRGYARIGNGTPVRLQVPATVDPLDDDAPAQLRDAVIALLPHRDSRTEAAAAPPRPDRPPVVTADGTVPPNHSVDLGKAEPMIRSRPIS